MPDVAMPRLSDSMEEGTILKWLLHDGAIVKAGDELAEIEADKATETMLAPAEGVLAIVAQEGETLAVGTLIATITELAVAAEPQMGEAPQPEAAEATGGAKGAPRIVAPNRAQAQFARRVAESRATVPDLTLGAEIDMQQCVALRARLRDASGGQAPLPTYTDMVVKACALALRDHPRANGAYRDAQFELYPNVNIAVVVAAQDSIVSPTVLDADRKSLGDIARETRTLAQRARDGEITQPELAGATFTVSSLGMYGVQRFAAVISPPQAAVLGVGAVTERPAVRNGQLVARHLMDVTLTCDHRILYSTAAAAFLQRIRELLEEPFALVL